MVAVSWSCDPRRVTRRRNPHVCRKPGPHPKPPAGHSWGRGVCDLSPRPTHTGGQSPGLMRREERPAVSAGSREQLAGPAWPRQAPASVCLLLPACGASCSRALAVAITLQEPPRQHVQHWGLGCSACEGAGEAACRCKREQVLLCWAGLHRPTAGLPLWTHVLPSLTLMDPASTPSTDTPPGR